MRAAFSGCERGIFTTEMPSCGGWQSGKDALGAYEETYTNTSRLPGTRVWVWEPQLVSTAAT